MAQRVLLAAALSAVVIFLWGFVYWGPVLNMTVRLMKPLPAEAELDVLAPLRAQEMASGMYVYPGPPPDQGDAELVAAWEEKLAAGPILHMAYHRGGGAPMDPGMFAKGFVHGFVVALLAAVLLAQVAHALPGYGSRVLVLALASLIAAIWTNYGNAVWRLHPLDYATGEAVYTFVAGLFMAVITAAIVRPPLDPAPA